MGWATPNLTYYAARSPEARAHLTLYPRRSGSGW